MLLVFITQVPDYNRKYSFDIPEFSFDIDVFPATNTACLLR